jgi:hypothetical protein
MRHLVKYDFELELQPLFITSHEGNITPVKNKGNATNHLKLGLEKLEWTSPITIPAQEITSEQLFKKISEFRTDALKLNDQFRTENKLQKMFWYEHFLVEGKVLYLLDKSGELLSRDSMYKIKPEVIEKQT